MSSSSYTVFPQHICTKCHNLKLTRIFPIKRKNHNFGKKNHNLWSKCDFLASIYFFILLQSGIGFDLFCVLTGYSISLLSEAQKSRGVSGLTLSHVPAETLSSQSQCLSPQCFSLSVARQEELTHALAQGQPRGRDGNRYKTEMCVIFYTVSVIVSGPALNHLLVESFEERTIKLMLTLW